MDNFQSNVDNSQTGIGQPLDVVSLDDMPKKIGGGGHPPSKINTAVKDTIKTTKEVIYGREDYPASQQRIINKYGEYRIKNIRVGRTPLPSIITKILNVVSLGAYNKLLKESPYDKLFHLFVVITLSNGTVVKILLEKNEALNMKVVSNYNPTGAEYMEVTNIPSDLTFSDLLNGARKRQGSNYFKYNALHNNCQDFIMDLLKGSSISNNNLQNFIKQDVKSIFKNYPRTRKFINTITDIGGKIDIVRKGLKI